MAIILYKGADATITVNVKDKVTKKPVLLNGFTGATGYFAPETGASPVAVTGSLLSADCGQIQFSMSEDVTELLAAGDGQSMEVIYDQGATRTILQFLEQLDVKARLF